MVSFQTSMMYKIKCYHDRESIYIFQFLFFERTRLCMKQDLKYYMLKEDVSPCIFGPVQKQGWSYAYAKQMTDKLIYGHFA